MDFFARQDLARRRTKWLVLYFALAVASIVTMVYVASLFIFGYLQVKGNRGYDAEPVQFALWNPEIFLYATLGTVAVVCFGSLWKWNALSAGGSAVAESLGGRQVSLNTTNLDERRLLNVVEEMSIASGIAMPRVYVLDEESGINAFAAGFSTEDAVVAVTRGCLQKLSRDELQGVIAHEFSHILNGDMRLNLRIMGVVFGILCLSVIGRILLRTRGKKNPLPLLGLALLIIGIVGVFFGRLIQAAISRQREFLADASSVQFTRNPAGLSGALQKIGSVGSALESDHAQEASHLFFCNGMTSSMFSPFATHPPLEERIRAIDPAWDGKYKPLTAEKFTSEPVASKSRARPVFMDGKMLILTGAVLDAQQNAPPVRPRIVLTNVGNPAPVHLRYAEEMREALTDSLRNTAREPLAAAALIFALLLDADEALRSQQLGEISRRMSASVSDKTAALFPEVSAVARRTRLPLVNLAIGALRNLTEDESRQFLETLHWLVGSDGRVELFEFVLQKIVQRHIGPKAGHARRSAVEYYTLKPLVPDCALVLSALARVGAADEADVQKAFDEGAPYLRAPADAPVELFPLDQCGVDAIDAALTKLSRAVPIIRKNLIDACAHVVGADGLIQESEAELLRAIAETLDCPLPPLVEGE